MPNAETYHGYIKLGICPSCRQNTLFGDERSCPECKAKNYAYRMSIDKEHKNKIHREWSKRTHAEMIERGICTRCRKRKADGGFKTCAICRAKKNKRYAEKNYDRIGREERFRMGICCFCQNPVEDGYKVCEYHHKKNIEYANSDNSKRARRELLRQGILY